MRHFLCKPLKMGWDYDRMESTYRFANHCVCGGYYTIDPEREVIATNPPLWPVKCRICLTKIYTNEKQENAIGKTEAE
jgi:hypothetical protein